jgi:hypothetical protein
MDTKTRSAIIAVGIGLALVQLFCALWIREAIHDEAVDNAALERIAARLAPQN